MTMRHDDIDPHLEQPRVGRVIPIGHAMQAVAEGGGIASPAVEPLDVWEARDQRVQALRAADAAQRASDARRNQARLLVEQHFPVIAVDAALTFGSPESLETLAREAARVFAGRTDTRILVLAGGTGAGKTSAAAWVGLEVGGFAPGYVRAGELEARGRYDRELRTWLHGRSMLVIDDLGVEVNDQHGNFRSLLDEVFDMFYGDRKRVVITTNVKRPDVVERYGRRVASRLYETGRWASCGDDDLRLRVR
jgi:DNA replication protein DnaC